jgi:hypothetical protein
MIALTKEAIDQDERYHALDTARSREQVAKIEAGRNEKAA